MDEMELPESILDQLEDIEDAYCCREALENLDLSQTVPWEDIKSELGLE
jgi:hypothetical protein